MTTDTNAASGAAAELVAPVQAETPEVATPESGAANAPPEAPAKPDEAADAEKAIKRLQRRIDRVTAARYSEAARADQLAQRLAEYERQQSQPTESLPIKPEEIEGMVRAKAQEIAAQQALQSRVQSVLERGDEIPDFTNLCNTVNEEVPFYAQGKPTAFLEAVLDADSPEKLLAHLGQNPELVEGLQGLSSSQLGRRLARIEAEIAKPKEAPKPSAAPKPLEPVKGATETSKDPSQMTDAEFAAWRKRQIAHRR